MGLSYLYNVYDGDTLILENATYKDLFELLGRKPTNLESYIEKQYKYNGRYLVTYASKEETSSFIAEWEKARAPFLKVAWSKTEGRKLSLRRLDNDN